MANKRPLFLMRDRQGEYAMYEEHETEGPTYRGKIHTIAENSRFAIIYEEEIPMREDPHNIAHTRLHLLDIGNYSTLGMVNFIREITEREARKVAESLAKRLNLPLIVADARDI